MKFSLLRNYKSPKGMVFAIEPIIVEDSYDVEVLSDDWTVVTKDKGMAARRQIGRAEKK